MPEVLGYSIPADKFNHRRLVNESDLNQALVHDASAVL
jgi:hypothetical protein